MKRDIHINDKISIPAHEIEIKAIRAQGPGGQNVNKVNSAIHLRFNIHASSLSERVKVKLIRAKDPHMTDEGVLIIKAQNHRTQNRNYEEALNRLRAIITHAVKVQKLRVKTRPSRSVKARRLKHKSERSALKKSRGRVKDFD